MTRPQKKKTAIQTAALSWKALKGDDKADIEAKMQTLSEASATLAQKMYAEPGEGAAGEAAADDDQAML